MANVVPITVLKIRKAGASSWSEIPVPVAIQGGSQVLDGPNSGRDTNTGYMHRDIIRDDVAEYNITLPAGIDNLLMSYIKEIVTSPAFEMYVPDLTHGAYPGQRGRFGITPVRQYYCATFEPEIDIIHSDAWWEYKEYTFKAVEI